MSYLLLACAVAATAAQKIFVKQYNVKSSLKNPFLFSAVSAAFAMLFFVIISGFKLNFNAGIIPYSIGFAIASASALAGFNLALSTGPLSVSSLINSYSLIIPTLYGIIFLKEDIDITVYPGIALLCISLLLINIKKEKLNISLKWGFYIFLAFAGNGICSVVQKMQQMNFDGAYKNEFMITAFGIVVIILLACSFGINGDKKQMIKDCRIFAPLAGISNGLTNLLVMVLTAAMPAAILFPSFSAGGIIVMFFIGLFVYKEKLSKLQMIGYAIGVVSIVLLNL